MESREIKSIGEIALVTSGGTPSTTNESNFSGDIPWITPKDLSNYDQKYISFGERSISLQGLRSSGAKMIPKNSILITSRAPVGYIAIAGKELTTNQGFKNLILRDGYDHNYVYYLLKYNRLMLEKHASGSVFPELSSEAIKKIRLPFHQYNAQVRIGKLLGEIDNKIDQLGEINTRIDDLLLYAFGNLMSRTNENNKKKLGALVEMTLGSTPDTKNENYWNGEIEWLTPRDLSDKRFPVILGAKRKITSGGLRSIRNILMKKNDIVISCRAPVGYLAILGREMSINQGFIGMKTKNTIGSVFLYYWCKHNMPQIKSRSNGTTFDELRKSDFKNMDVILPSQKDLEIFEETGSSGIAIIEQNMHLQRKLKDLKGKIESKYFM